MVMPANGECADRQGPYSERTEGKGTDSERARRSRTDRC